MKKGLVLIILIALMVGVLLSGCSKDEEAKVISTVCPKLLATAMVKIRPYLDFDIDLQPLSYPVTRVDSVIFTDRKCEGERSYWWVYGDELYDWFGYSDKSDSLRYHAGDTVEMKIYVNGSVVTTRLRTVGYYQDTVLYIVPQPNDTVSFGQNIAIVWNKVARAEWYGIKLYYYYDSSGTWNSRRTYIATKDTAYTIPGLSTAFDGYYRIYIVSAVGPYPATDAFNISGGGITGAFFSRSKTAYVRVYVKPGGGSSVASYPEEEEPLEASSDEILKVLIGAKEPPTGSTVEIITPATAMK